MTESPARAVTYLRRPATLTVMRNNGYAWGRLRLPSGAEFDVSLKRQDVYDLDNDEALDKLERALRRADCVQPATSWLNAKPAPVSYVIKADGDYLHAPGEWCEEERRAQRFATRREAIGQADRWCDPDVPVEIIPV